MVTNKSLLLNLLLLVGGSSASSDITSEGGEYRISNNVTWPSDGDVDMVSAVINGIEFRAPYYEKGEQALTDEARKVYNDVSFELYLVGRWFVNAAISDEAFRVYESGASKISSILNLRKYLWKFGLEHDLKDDPQFRFDMLDILDYSVDKKHLEKSRCRTTDRVGICQQEEETMNAEKNRENREKYLIRMKTIFAGAHRLTLNSPVGLHLDYRKMTVDGGSALDELREIFDYIYEAGYALNGHHVMFEWISDLRENLESYYNIDMELAERADWKDL